MEMISFDDIELRAKRIVHIANNGAFRRWGAFSRAINCETKWTVKGCNSKGDKRWQLSLSLLGQTDHFYVIGCKQHNNCGGLGVINQQHKVILNTHPQKNGDWCSLTFDLSFRPAKNK